MKFLRLLASSTAAAALTTLLSAATPAMIAAESAKANELFERFFDESVARSPMTMTQLGMKTGYGRWDDFSDEKALGDVELSVKQLMELKRSVNFEQLDEQAKVSYRMFVYSVERGLEGWRWRHHNYPLNQMYGLHSQVPGFLIAFHTVSNAAEAQAYTDRLRGIPALFDQVIEGVKVREAKGILPPKFVFPIVIEACRTVIRGEPFDLSNEKSALWQDIETKFAAIKEADEHTKAELKSFARAALVDSVQPAYEKLIAVLEAQEKIATTDDGAWKLPHGREYYDYELRGYTTTDLSADEIHQTGLREVARIHAEMTAIKDRVGFKGTLQEFFVHMRESPQYYHANTPEGKQAYIDRANGFIEAMRARLPEFFGILPKAALELRKVEPFREEGSPAAFYEQPAPDGSRPGVYYVNTFDMRGLPIYEMESLAYHEAIPGHHMQIAIAQELEGIPRFRRFGGNTAYAEGWALYTEYFPKEFGFFTDPYMDFGRLSSELLRAARLVVDTGIHAQKWTREQTMQWMRANSPFPERDIFTETNRYIVIPGQACSYKIGMLKILELRELAKQELGAKFNLRAYHDLVLKDGAVPMDILEENVRAWIARRKAE